MSEINQGMSIEAKSAASEFLASFRSFRDEMERRVDEMAGRIDVLDRKSAEIRRPALSGAAEIRAPHAKAMAAYLREGDEGGFRSLAVETKGLNTALAAEGGYLVD